MDSLGRSGRGVFVATAVDVEVTDTPAAVISVHGAGASSVHGHISSSAAGTVVLEGSADGTTWFQDTGSAATGTTPSLFRFDKPWAYYRLMCAAASGTVTVTATLAGLTT
jgi:hypothetical protein